MNPTLEPCEICGYSIVWAAIAMDWEIRFKPGRLTGGHPLTYGTVSQRWFCLDTYRAHKWPPLSDGRLVHPIHKCNAKPTREWLIDGGDSKLLKGRTIQNMILGPNHPYLTESSEQAKGPFD